MLLHNALHVPCLALLLFARILLVGGGEQDTLMTLASLELLFMLYFLP
jgi:hypothetical protein